MHSLVLSLQQEDIKSHFPLDFFPMRIEYVIVQFFELLAALQIRLPEGVTHRIFLNQLKMKQSVLCIITVLSVLIQCASGYTEEVTTHVYKVTSYNLGAITDPVNLENARFSTDYSPLLITGTAGDIFDSEHKASVSLGETTSTTSGINGFALSASFEATQRISVQGAFGVARNLWAPDSINYESESSWEANLGIIYKLLDNLSYELHFGYLDTGDIFTDRSSYTDVESIIMISNKLTMGF